MAYYLLIIQNSVLHLREITDCRTAVMVDLLMCLSDNYTGDVIISRKHGRVSIDRARQNDGSRQKAKSITLEVQCAVIRHFKHFQVVCLTFPQAFLGCLDSSSIQ